MRAARNIWIALQGVTVSYESQQRLGSLRFVPDSISEYENQQRNFSGKREVDEYRTCSSYSPFHLLHHKASVPLIVSKKVGIRTEVCLQPANI